jgi:hypothetical protein
MQTFARMEELEPMLQGLGSLEDIEIDLSEDSLMEIPEPDEEDQEGDTTVNVRKNVENAVYPIAILYFHRHLSTA